MNILWCEVLPILCAWSTSSNCTSSMLSNVSICYQMLSLVIFCYHLLSFPMIFANFQIFRESLKKARNRKSSRTTRFYVCCCVIHRHFLTNITLLRRTPICASNINTNFNYKSPAPHVRPINARWIP
jgi:hypothetical protein